MMRLRWTKADKKHIARYQNQEIIEEGLWSATTRVVGYRCKKCRREIPLDILEVDHIIPVSKGGKDNPANLQLLCPPCNKKKGARCKITVAKNTKIALKPKAAQKNSAALKPKAASRKPKTASTKTSSTNKRRTKPKK